jgi:carboxymethylenebutenolidase
MKHEHPETSPQHSLTRREFTALSIAAGVMVATAANTASEALEVSEKEVEIKTPSGVCDAALIQPSSKGRWPAAILFADAGGLRASMRDMAKRLAAGGYVVLVPNPYYRTTKAPGIDIKTFNFKSEEDRAKLTALRAPLTTENVGRDATAYLAFLDNQTSVKKNAKVGAFGYCMGGAMTMQAAAAQPDRIAAGASFHGGGLVTDKPESPHLLVPKLKAQYYFGVAANDDEREPEAKTKLAEAFKAAQLPAKVEVYTGALHGWCVRDMPASADRPIYDEPQAERAWGELVSLFKRTLV